MEAQPDFGEAGLSAEVLERRAENRNPAQHGGHCYTRLSVPEAIAQAKRSHSLLIVLLKGEGSQSLLADEKLHSLLVAKPFKYTALRLHDDLSNNNPRAFSTAKAFREYYPATVLPVLHVLDPASGKSLSKLEGPAVAAQAQQLISDLRLKAEKKGQPKAPVSSGTSTSSTTLQEAAQQQEAAPVASPGSSAKIAQTASALSPVQPQPSGSSLEDSAKEWDALSAPTRLAADQEKVVPRSAPQLDVSASAPEVTLEPAAVGAGLPPATAAEDAADTTQTPSPASTVEAMPSASGGSITSPQEPDERNIVQQSAPLSLPDPPPQAGGFASEPAPSSSSENLHGPTATQPGSSAFPAAASVDRDSSLQAAQKQKADHLPPYHPASPPRPGAGTKLLRTDKKPPTVGLDQITPSRRKPKPEEVGKVSFQALKEQLVNLQLRLTDGSVMRADFSANTRLADVAAHVSEHRTDGHAPYTLAVPFPRRMLGVDDLGKTLLELDLVPRSTLVLLPNANRSAHTASHSRTEGLWSRISAFLLSLILAIGSFLLHLNPLRNARQPDAAEPGPEQRRRQSDSAPAAATSYLGGSITPASLRQRQIRKEGEESNGSDSA